MDVDEALELADGTGTDTLAFPDVAHVLAVEVRRLQRELARFGDLPCDAAFYVVGPGREPEQLMFRRPDGGLVVLTREEA